MGLPLDTPLLRLLRLRRDGDRPLAILQNWLPPAYSDITREQLESDGLYALLRAKGGKPVVAHQRIGARPPSASERKHLGLTPSQPVLTMTRVAFDAVGGAGRVRRPLLPRPGLLHRGHARRALTHPTSSAHFPHAHPHVERPTPRRPPHVECPLPDTSPEEVCRAVPAAARRPPSAAPSVPRAVCAEPSLGRARHRLDRERFVASLQASHHPAGGRSRVTVAGVR